MIRKSFSWLEGIGDKVEKKIIVDVKDWNQFISKDCVKGISKKRKSYFDRSLIKARKELFNENSSYFNFLKPSETWKLYGYFKSEVIFIDIEVDSLGEVILIGIFDGIFYKTLLRGSSFDKDIIKNEFSKFKLIVSFNGRSFDIPIIEKYFGFKVNIPHFDLRGVCSRLGLKGGLKKIEDDLGIFRPFHLKAYGGDNPVWLWKAWKASGDSKYIETLIEYNEYDTVNLKKIADYCYRMLSLEYNNV